MGDDDEMGSLFVNRIILMPKNEYVELVTDAKYLNSDGSHQLLLALRTSGGDYDQSELQVSDLSCAYHQVPRRSETLKLTNFLVENCTPTLVDSMACVNSQLF